MTVNSKAFPGTIFLSISFVWAFAQPRWDTYLARYDEGLGSVIVNMDIALTMPHRDLPFLVITGVTFKGCNGDGLPVSREFKRLYRQSDDINRVIFQSSGGHTSASLLVGTFTYQCQRLDYIYVADTTGIRERLTNTYRKKYRNNTFHIQVMEDPEWEAYRDFLYPNEAVRIFMMNYKAVAHMRDAGDALSRARFVEHLIYFDTIKDREVFIHYIARMKYDIKDERETHRDSLRYQVRLARFGTVSLEELIDQTTYLNAKAREFNGVYDGWETKLIGSKQRFRLLHNALAEPINTTK